MATLQDLIREYYEGRRTKGLEQVESLGWISVGSELFIIKDCSFRYVRVDEVNHRKTESLITEGVFLDGCYLDDKIVPSKFPEPTYFSTSRSQNGVGNISITLEQIENSQIYKVKARGR